MCIHVCVFTYVDKDIHTYIVCIYIGCMYVCLYVCKYVCMYVTIYNYIYTYILCVYIYTHTYEYSRILVDGTSIRCTALFDASKKALSP